MSISTITNDINDDDNDDDETSLSSSLVVVALIQFCATDNKQVSHN